MIMSDGERRNKFVSTKVPLATYTSEDRLVNFAINTNPMQWIEGEEETLKNFYKGTFERMFDEIEYYQETIREINGKKFIVFEFLSTLKEENAFSGVKTAKNYSYIQYTAYHGQILISNFGCKPRQMNVWQPIVKEMMESMKVKK